MWAARPIAASSCCASAGLVLPEPAPKETSTWSMLQRWSGAIKLWTIETKVEPWRGSWIASGQSCTRAEWWGT